MKIYSFNKKTHPNEKWKEDIQTILDFKKLSQIFLFDSSNYMFKTLEKIQNNNYPDFLNDECIQNLLIEYEKQTTNLQKFELNKIK